MNLQEYDQRTEQLLQQSCTWGVVAALAVLAYVLLALFTGDWTPWM